MVFFSRTGMAVSLCAFLFAGFTFIHSPCGFTAEATVLQRPEKFYSLRDPVEYKVIVEPPADVEFLRMLSPIIETDNLQLLNIRQESTEISQKGQVFTFIFQAKKEGIAKIRKLAMRWRDAESGKTFELEIPPVTFNVSSPFIGSAWFWVLSGGLFFLFTGGSSILFFLKRKRKSVDNPPPFAPGLEDAAESELQCVRSKLSQENSAVFLENIQNIVRIYLEKKIGWISKRNGYDILKEKASALWTKADAEKLAGLLRSIESYRFSGLEIKASDVRNLCDEFIFLISKNKIVTPMNTD